MVLTALVVASACDPAPLYGPDGQLPGAGYVTPRTSWKITGNMKDCDFACDGKFDTAATAPAGAQAYVTIDLGKPCMFNFIAIDHGRDYDAFAKRVQIATSADGRNFTPQIVGPGTRRVSNFLLRRGVLARYVRITVVEPGSRPWSVAEIYLQ